jgi:hypothetical protein
MFLLGTGFSVSWDFCHNPPQAEVSPFAGVPPVLGVDLSPLLFAHNDIVVDCRVLLQ